MKVHTHPYDETLSRPTYVRMYMQDTYTIHFQRIWWINEYGRLTGCHWYLEMWWKKGLADKAVVD